MKKLIALILAFFVLTGFTSEKIKEGSVEFKAIAQTKTSAQPADERKAQDALPKAKDTLWTTLYKTKITLDEQKGIYHASFPDDVKKLNGQTVKISGFMLPLESTEKFKHFLLSKRTPTCYFCPPGEPNEVIEVFADKATDWDENLLTYEGKFELTDNGEKGIFFKMTDATLK